MQGSDVILQRLLTLHPKRIDLTLGRVLLLLEKLGNPHHKLPPTVHIAGTNGKGSTQAFSAEIAEAAGLRVHRYSSPHLVRFHERITLGGTLITEPDLCALLEECEQTLGREPITFFEITTAAAFLAFSRIPADILFLETGLGGRLDTTNVIEAPIAVQLSRIGMDHQEFLGNTLEAITTEKVHIARTGVPLVVGAQPEAALEVIKNHANHHNIPTYFLGQDYDYKVFSDGSWRWWTQGGEIKLSALPLRGRHQYENAALAVATMKILSEQIPINNQHISRGLKNTRWAGRMQRITEGDFADLLPEGVKLWLDGGHNFDAGVILADCLGDFEAPRIIVGMLRNKDCAGYLQCIDAYLKEAQSLEIPDSESALKAHEIAALHPEITPAESFHDAISRAIHSGGKNIVLCGSLYLIGAFLSKNNRHLPP